MKLLSVDVDPKVITLSGFHCYWDGFDITYLRFILLSFNYYYNNFNSRFGVLIIGFRLMSSQIAFQKSGLYLNAICYTSWPTRLCLGFFMSALFICLFVYISLYLCLFPLSLPNLTLNMPACQPVCPSLSLYPPPSLFPDKKLPKLRLISGRTNSFTL
jgi:hypothetical protein